MKNTHAIIASVFLLSSINLYSQTIKLDQSRFEASHVYVAIEKVMGKVARYKS